MAVRTFGSCESKVMSSAYVKFGGWVGGNWEVGSEEIKKEGGEDGPLRNTVLHFNGFG